MTLTDAIKNLMSEGKDKWEIVEALRDFKLKNGKTTSEKNIINSWYNVRRMTSGEPLVKRKPRESRMIELTAPEPTHRLVALIGSPHEIAEALKEMA